ncbi:hypothetical protein FEM03_12585 [Phragmitibacter flavus]|uniref:Uncharacterized protein n=1 Tax=Phragmitibacter flavus TaxID=2576071 RepID=A0A5R8KE20_9BACT|nr:hypothetical protein [Phragmitibacter flavus]TLD70554.1 hypothetical protein FEM03_12585 [Phragmitibacter flavus]
MSTLRILGICASGLLACCSSSPTPGGISRTQEFNPSTSQWVTSERVVVTAPAQLAKPVAVAETAPAPDGTEETPEPGLLKKTGGALKAPFKWIPGVN